MSRENVWHEVPDNPGCIRVGNAEFNVVVKCLPGEKTEWAVIEWSDFEKMKSDETYYAEIHGKKIDILSAEGEDIIGMLPNSSLGMKVYTGKGRIIFIPWGITTFRDK